MLINFVKNRNFILILSLLAGIFLPQGAVYLKHYTSWILVAVMLFSTSGIAFSALTDFRYLLKVTAVSILLNFVVLGSAILGLAYFLIDDPLIFAGFLVVAAGPPGVVVVPFSYSFKSDVRFAMSGILGAYLVSIFLTPLIISQLSSETIAYSSLVKTMLIIVVFPLLLSRLLRLKATAKFAERARGRVTDWGFALLIYTSIGLNKDLIFSDIDLLIRLLLVFGISMFGLGILYNVLMKKRLAADKIISRNLMLTTKSTGFSVAAALAIFDERAAIPAAVLSVVVLFYLMSVNLLQRLTLPKINQS